MTQRIGRLVSAVAIFGAGCCDLAAQPNTREPGFRFVSPELVLPSDRGAAEGKLVLEGDNLAVPDAPLTDLADAEIGAGPAKVTADPSFEPSGTTRHWPIVVKLDRTSVVPERRYVRFRYAGTPYVLALDVKREGGGEPAMTVVAPRERSLHPREGLPILVTVGDAAVHNLRIAEAALTTDPSKRSVAGGWKLCEEDRAPTTCSGLGVPPNSVKSFRLWPNDPAGFVGKYAGSIYLVADGARAATEVPLTVFGTSDDLQALGVFAILLGVVVSWIFGTLLQFRANRLQLLRPFADLQRRALQLRRRYGQLSPGIREAASRYATAVDRLLDEFGVRHLMGRGVLPAWFPSALGTPPNVAEAYKVALARATAKEALLDLVLTEGLSPLDAIAAAADAESVEEAARALGEMAQEDALTDATRTRILQILNDARGAKGFAAVVPSLPLTVQAIDVQLYELNVVTWILFGILAVALGSYVMVLSNPGFGAVTDLLFCVFWGIGLPAGAQQIGQASVGSVVSALHVVSPRP